ncbi:U2 small nuclear ribonucleoprotein A'-like [Aegilops tauschii subsp. strangulata]|uniref:U2 small nuclear ribonucleoprotein A'-like n=1 Tax=Aegilops tauschii subsp. strangulata TaxID=200361 RepID=UPI00098ADF49|nr:U2 small nuclear ribonucleoprotein A'-like [Aegilops tauschii subsp. strangulata]
MARLSADLIRRSPQFVSALKQRVLDLRGNKIAVIDNLGATEDQFDTIDLLDNEIVRLENFPFMNRLGTLLINNNRITCINPNLGEFLPKMHTLVLTNNRLTSLAEIDPLASLPKLQFLSILDNTVTKQPDYRLYVIHKLKHLRLLDFKKVNQQERAEAAQKFHSNEAEEAAEKVAAKAYTPVVMDAQGTTKDQGPKVVAPTPAQITAIKAAIVYCQTVDEVTRLEKALSTAQVPAEYYVITKPDTNIAEASEEAQAEKMETDGQEQEDGADEQKRNDEGTIQEDQFDTIDLSDNEIVRLENLPFVDRLGSLLINSNRITRINANLGDFLLNIHTLVLTNNRLTSLAEIDPLASLSCNSSAYWV